MSENKKVPEEQLEAIRNLQFKVDAILRQYGFLHLQKKAIDAELAEIEQQIEQFEAERLNIIEVIKTKFGSTGTVNLETGDFVPD